MVHTASAARYPAAKDIALLGEDAFYEGLFAELYRDWTVWNAAECESPGLV